MALKLQILLILGSLLFMFITVILLRKEVIELKYSLTWIFSSVCLIIIAAQPEVVRRLSYFAGIIEPVNAVFLAAIFFLLLIVLNLTVAVSKHTNAIKKLVQHNALLEDMIKEHFPIQNNTHNT